MALITARYGQPLTRPHPRHEHAGQSPRTAWAKRLAIQVPGAYARGELTVSELAELFSVTEATIVGYLVVPVRQRRLHDVRVLHTRGVGRLEIATRLKLKADTISNYLRELTATGEIDSPACPHCGR